MNARRISSLVPGRGREGMLEITRRCRRIATRDRALQPSLHKGAQRADSEGLYQTALNLPSGLPALVHHRNSSEDPAARCHLADESVDGSPRIRLTGTHLEEARRPAATPWSAWLLQV